MFKEAKIKEWDVHRAHRNGCDEVKKALEDLFPSLELGKKIPPENITNLIDWGVEGFSDDRYWIIGTIDGIDAFYVSDVKAITFNHPDYKKSYAITGATNGFKISRK